MANTTVIAPPAGAPSKAFDVRVVLAFFAIYFLWGTSFLAIRIAVLEVPPLFAAGTRFFVAGAVLFGFMRFRGETRPTASQWRSLALIGLLMFVAEYGPLFWAEKYVPSGIASVLEATLPLITMALEVWVFRRHRFHWPLLAAILIGFAGVSSLLFHNGEQNFGILPCVAILAGATAWSLGSVLNRSLDLPESRVLTSGAAMLLGGAMLLALSASFGELHPFPHVSMRAAMALLYLIVCGSLLGFTAFVWLLARMPATRVSSHAYVNPVVAVALGYFVAGETITMRTLLGTALVLASVVLILRKDKVAV
ncbi:MAG TPA: EamA family transporter [Bryobacteraceae bacterium]|nr:EamA family transporter [Bryobacteraceae bacterium]